jgi:hypothetical protein
VAKAVIDTQPWFFPKTADEASTSRQRRGASYDEEQRVKR